MADMKYVPWLIPWPTEDLLPDPLPDSADLAGAPTLEEVLAEADEEPSESWLMAHYG